MMRCETSQFPVSNFIQYSQTIVVRKSIPPTVFDQKSMGFFPGDCILHSSSYFLNQAHARHARLSSITSRQKTRHARIHAEKARAYLPYWLALLILL